MLSLRDWNRRCAEYVLRRAWDRRADRASGRCRDDGGSLGRKASPATSLLPSGVPIPSVVSNGPVEGPVVCQRLPEQVTIDAGDEGVAYSPWRAWGHPLRLRQVGRVLRTVHPTAGSGRTP